jgi:uncharacterized protein (TIGR02996 family)
MNEEAGFLAGLLAEPDDVTTLLVYADWLDDRADPRAEYLRLLAANQLDQRRLAELRRAVDPVWALAVTNRLACGCWVRVTSGSFHEFRGEVIAARLDDMGELVVRVRMTILGRPVEVDYPSQMLERAPQAA